MKHLAEGFRSYAKFTGRSTRAAFWDFVGITQLITVFLLLPAFYMLVQFWVYVNEQEEYLNFAVGVITDPIHTLPGATDDLRDMIWRMAECYFSEPWTTNPVAMWSLVVAGAWALIIALPTLAITVRRLRDAGASPWWVLPPLLSFIPVSPLGQIGLLLSLITIVECCRASQLPPVPMQPHA